jgi:hypothetical protein
MATVVSHIVDPGEGAGHDYHSLSLWDAGENGDLTGVRDEIATAICRSTSGVADTTVCDLDGWTTSATQYINIIVDTGHRHVGVWDDNKYRLVTSNDYNMYVREQYVRFDGIQFGLSGTITTARTPFYFLGFSTTANHVRFSNCIITGHTNASYRWTPISIGYIPIQLALINCLIYKFPAESLSYLNVVGDANTVVNIYNCTIITNATLSYGIRREAGTLNVTNTYVSGGVGGSIYGTVTQTTNATSDTTAVGTAGDSIAVNTTNFVAPASDPPDYRLPLGSALIGIGTTGPFSSPFDYTTDVAGQSRTTTWDIGAHEYVASGTTYATQLFKHVTPQFMGGY